jgi:deoxyribonuclease V
MALLVTGSAPPIVRVPPLHPRDLTPTQAVALQRELAAQVIEAPVPPVKRVAGVDVSVRDDRVRAAIVVVELPGLNVVATSTWEGPVAFPYIPGLLSFRELPALWPALEKLEVEPEVFLLDAQGRSHPRRFGLACHFGVLLDRPAVGVAKSRLVGRYTEPGPEKGDVSDLEHRGEIVGQVVRTREGVNPVFVSVGHRVTLPDAVSLVLQCATRYKLPQPAHLAHRLSKYGQL